MDRKKEKPTVPTSATLSTQESLQVTSELSPRTLSTSQVSSTTVPPTFYSGYLPPPGGYMYPPYYPPPSHHPSGHEFQYRQRLAQQSQPPDAFSGSPAGTRTSYPSSSTSHSVAPTGPLVFESPTRSYKLVIRQQPLRARMCGCGDKDRRAVDPPAIVQLQVIDKEGEAHLDPEDLHNLSNLVLYADLWSADKGSRVTFNIKIPHQLPILLGTLAVNACVLADTTGAKGIYFIFQDMSVRIEGTFRLKFSLIDLEGAKGLVQKTRVAATEFSEPFTVYTPKTFPGMADSSDLAKAFATQGYKIPVRKERPKANASLQLSAPHVDSDSGGKGD